VPLWDEEGALGAIRTVMQKLHEAGEALLQSSDEQHYFLLMCLGSASTSLTGTLYRYVYKYRPSPHPAPHTHLSRSEVVPKPNAWDILKRYLPLIGDVLLVVLTSGLVP
jgi:hypothetical protein